MSPCTPSVCAPETSTNTASFSKPRYSVNPGKEAYEVRVELPGVRKDSVTVNLDQNVLTIQAQRKPAAAENWKPLHRELRSTGYALRLKLNVPVNDAALTAKLEDGVLVLNLPVQEAAKPRTISIQ